MTRVLESIAAAFGLSLKKINDDVSPLAGSACDIFVDNHSQLSLATLGDFVGSHLVRDLRDVVVSGYFYHLWTNESWAHVPQAAFGQRSYQEHLKSLDEHAGIMAEIDWLAAYVDRYRLRDLKLEDERIIQMRFETLSLDPASQFAKLFSHYGFNPKAIRRCVNLAQRQSFTRVRRSLGKNEPMVRHLRSGQHGQWREVLSHEHRRHFNDRLGELLVRWGYESDGRWAESE